jgi:enolase-phosphatase E1
VTFPLREHGVEAVLLDIEGTTTPIAFVHDVLFAFARDRLSAYLTEHTDAVELRDLLATLRVEWQEDAQKGEAPPAWTKGDVGAAAGYLSWLMDRDRKSPALKRLQGWIWESGYRSGALRGDVFPDVKPAFERWREAGIDVAIYSSGSVLAQQLLFGATADGDLTPFISAFFDTGVGAKTSPDSYRRIAAAMHHAAGRILFVSDTPAELEAARLAEYQVRWVVRPGNRAAGEPHPGDAIRSFEDLPT